MYVSATEDECRSALAKIHQILHHVVYMYQKGSNVERQRLCSLHAQTSIAQALATVVGHTYGTSHLTPCQVKVLQAARKACSELSKLSLYRCLIPSDIFSCSDTIANASRVGSVDAEESLPREDDHANGLAKILSPFPGYSVEDLQELLAKKYENLPTESGRMVKSMGGSHQTVEDVLLRALRREKEAAQEKERHGRPLHHFGEFDHAQEVIPLHTREDEITYLRNALAGIISGDSKLPVAMGAFDPSLEHLRKTTW